ncbi:MAG: hypothetical protein GX493_10870 [Firmicutes bacterium]|nr:hypothetical protein [Bacillota bacterium]
MAKAEGTAGEAVKTRRARYTPEENEMLFEMWWDPVKRRELPRLIGRNLTALRSQFCRLLKEKGISNEDYYRLMGERYGRTVGGRYGLRRRMRANGEQDQLILEIFAKHHALGNTKTKACEELRKILGLEINNSALKLRFYRLMNRYGLTNQDLIEIGRKVLARGSAEAGREEKKEEEQPMEKVEMVAETSTVTTVQEEPSPPPAPPGSDLELLAHLAHLPAEVAKLQSRLEALEEYQRHQLDLRGFIEHLLAVERDLKEEDRLKAEIKSLHEENYRLTQEIAAEKKRIRAREQELEEIYQLLNTVLHDFMHLESVAKLASLGDFIHRLEVTVDQFGNVLRCRRV